MRLGTKARPSPFLIRWKSTPSLVVHVIHRGTAIGVEENISDAQILSAVHALNEDFRKVAGSNGDGLGVDVLVEFELAKRTPDGLPTTGIVRVDGTGFELHRHGIASLETLPGADQTEVKALTFLAGRLPTCLSCQKSTATMAVVASKASPTPDPPAMRDGVTLLYNVIGTEGTLKPGRTSTEPHPRSRPPLEPLPHVL